MIQGIFPIPVGRYSIERPISNDEIHAVNSQEKTTNFGNSISVNKAVLDIPELKEIKDTTEKYLTEYFNTVYSPENNIKIYITQSWLNWTDTGQYHHKHSHPNSFVSGVLYLQADKDIDKIMFYKDTYRQFEIPAVEQHIMNSDSWWFSVGAGDILFFPSSLVHAVLNVETPQTRISLSFNTFIEGELGFEQGPTTLILKK
jgi:uncharacterized protein (TIGR02466 family)